MLYEDEVEHSDLPTSPGELELIEGYTYHPTELQLIDYGEEELTEKIIEEPHQVKKYIDSESVTWLNVNGLQDTAALEQIRDLFQIHPLVQEDLIRPYQRPKIEKFEDHFVIILQLFHPENPQDTEQILLVLGEHYLVTFQEFAGDVFDPVRKRIRGGRSRIRTNGPDYLAYALLDAVVDSYFPLLEKMGDDLEELEEQIIKDTSRDLIEEIHEKKQHLMILRRSSWSQREMLAQIQREDNVYISDETQVYFRDAYDHAIRILDIIESYREMTASLRDLYMTTISNRMNEIMKILTIIGSIFLPLTFIAGIYGMNFNPEVSPWNMPELNAYWGYPAVVALMIVLALGMVVFFKKKNWL
ncbi:MAG: magnesium/cobalt transporter CorA [bacterium]